MGWKNLPELVLIAICLIMPVFALSKSEMDALNALRTTFPPLRTNFDWKGNASTACQGWNGILCNDGHIDTLYLTLLIMDYAPLPSEISGLQWLKKLYIHGDALVGTLPSSMALMNLSSFVIESKNIEEPLPDLSQCKFLKSLSIIGATKLKVIPQWIWKVQTLESLVLSHSSFEGPIDGIGQLTKLQDLYIDGTPIKGPLPESFGNLLLLREFKFDSSQLTGPLPSSIGQLKNLLSLHGNNARITGPLPTSLAWCNELIVVQLKSNLLTGPLPADIGNMSRLMSLDLSGNQLDGPISDSFAMLPALESADFSRNKFSSLPSFDNFMLGHLQSLDISYNQLEGSIYQNLLLLPKLKDLLLQHNNLSGELEDYPDHFSKLEQLDISFNQISGTVPSIFSKQLAVFHATANQLEGTLRPMTRIRILDLSFNRISGWGDFFKYGSQSFDLANLKSNQLSGTLTEKDIMSFMNANILILANNSLHGTFPTFNYVSAQRSHHFDFSFNQFQGNLPTISLKNGGGTISVLDFSFNNFSGTIPANWGQLPGLETLNVANNHITGDLFSLEGSSSLQSLSIQDNLLEFPASQLHQFSLLTYINGRNNRIFGSFDPNHLPNVEYIDLSRNHLNGTFYIDDLAKCFSGSLRYLSIKDNLKISHHNALIPGVQLSSKNTYQPQNFSSTICFSFELTTPHSSLFEFDDDLFNYLQCKCSAGYFGKPPHSCYTCPPTFNCDGPVIAVPKAFFVYNSNITASADSHDYDTCFGPIGVDICPVGPIQGLSNCRGSSINFNESFSLANASQCATGSAGRLCSNCLCDLNRLNGGKCYFSRGPTCIACSQVWTNGIFFAILAPILIVLFALSAVIMYLVIQSHRSSNKTPWEKLPMLKRVIHRLKHLASLGMVSILVGFLQLYAELTNFYEYALRAWLQVVNGELDGLGLICIAPFTRTPISRLLGRMLLPIGVSVLLSGSIYVANLMHKVILKHTLRKRQESENEVDDGFVAFSEDELLHEPSPSASSSYYGGNDAHQRLLLIQDQSEPKQPAKIFTDTFKDNKEARDYPAHALVSNVGISVLRFFYFSVALGATEYFFSVVQLCTGLRFVQSHPWMLYSDASSLRKASIPILVLYVAGLPLTFAIVLFKFRKSVASSRFDMYLGSTVSRFHASTCWWELVLVARKLFLALVLRGIDKSSSLYGGLLLFILCSHAFLHVLLLPWKNKLYNHIDFVGALLLILSQTGTESGLDRKSHSELWQYALLALVIIYLVVVVGIILYETFMLKTDYQLAWEAHHLSSGNRDDLMLPVRLDQITAEEEASSKITTDDKSSWSAQEGESDVQ